MIIEGRWFWTLEMDGNMQKAVGPYLTRPDALNSAYDVVSPQLTMFDTPHVVYVGQAEAEELSDRDENLIEYALDRATARAFEVIRETLMTKTVSWGKVSRSAEGDLRKKIERLFWDWLADHNFDKREYYLDNLERYEFYDVVRSSSIVRPGDFHRPVFAA